MSIGSIAASVYTNQLTPYNQINPAVKQTESTELSSKTSVGDSAVISEQAQEALKQKTFSDKAYNLLIVRKMSGEEIKRFGSIIQDADSAENAKDFLKNLSGEQRDLLKRANSYGINITDSHINTMTEEGARNMLVQPDNRSYVDFNNDGIVDHGVAKSFVFPPPNSPESVKDAWDKTLEGIPENERLMASSIFLTQQLSANIKVDAQGNAVGFYQAGEEGYANIFSTQKSGWFNLLDKCDEYLDFAEKYSQDSRQTEQIQKNRELIGSFRSNLAQT